MQEGIRRGCVMCHMSNARKLPCAPESGESSYVILICKIAIRSLLENHSLTRRNSGNCVKISVPVEDRRER